MEEIVNFAEKLGLMVSKEATELLAANKNWKKILEELASEGQLFIEPKILDKKLLRTKMANSIKEEKVHNLIF